MSESYRNRGWSRDEDLRIPAADTELAYLAALIDGEGAITRYTNGGYWHVKVGMTDFEVIEYLETIGGRALIQERPAPRKTIAKWDLGRQRHVLLFLMAVEPWMKVKVKKQRAHEAVREIASRLGIDPVEEHRKRSQILSFKHHTIAARAEDPDQAIEEAEVEEMSTRELDRKVSGKEPEPMQRCPTCNGRGRVPVE